MNGPGTRGHIPRACLDSGFISALRCSQTTHTPRRCLGWPGTRVLFYPPRRLALDAGGGHVSLEEDSLESIHDPHLWLSRHRVGTEDTLSYSSRTSSRPLRPRPRILAFSRSWSMDGQPFAHPATEVVLDIMRRTSRIVAVARGLTTRCTSYVFVSPPDDESEEEESKKFPGWFNVCVLRKLFPNPQ